MTLKGKDIENMKSKAKEKKNEHASELKKARREKTDLYANASAQQKTKFDAEKKKITEKLEEKTAELKKKLEDEKQKSESVPGLKQEVDSKAKELIAESN